MTMPAVVLTAQGRIALQDRPRPTLRPDQVLVEVDLCGICGSDLHASGLPQVYRGDCILGHESTGRVAAVGDDVADWAAGQRVAGNPNGDGTCVYCRSGRPNFCRQATLETALGLQADGALAPLMAAFPGHLRRIPDELGTLEAAWVEPTATALRAVELAGELAGRTVLVTGGGPIGQLACRLAHLRSPAQILLMEPAAQRAQFATDSHAVPLAADAADGHAGGPPVDVVLECSGSAAATSSALKLLAPGGILVVVGAGPEPGLDSATILLKEITVRGSYIYTDEFDRAIHLLATQQITVADLTTVISPLPDALTAFDALRAGDIMKALIAPGTQPQPLSDTQAKGMRK